MHSAYGIRAAKGKDKPGLRALIATVLALAALCVGEARAETYRLRYEAAILGVVVIGEARYEVTATPTRYAVRATLRTSGAARIFDQTQIDAASLGSIDGGNIYWGRYDLSHSYARKFRRIRLDRAAGVVTPTVEPHYGDLGTPPASAAQQRASYDPLTAFFALGRQIGIARACTGGVLVFDGRQHYRLSVSAKSRGNFNSGGYNGPALVCNFHYQPIAGFTETPRNIPVAEAWFALPARPGFAAPLRLTVPTPVGDARLDLRGYEAR